MSSADFIILKPPFSKFSDLASRDIGKQAAGSGYNNAVKEGEGGQEDMVQDCGRG